MSIVKVCLALICVSSVSSASPASVEERSFSVRQPPHRRRGEELISDATDFLLTFSDDGVEKTLPIFYIDLIETNDTMSDDAMSKVSSALDKFLLAELDAWYDPDFAIVNISTTILNHSSFFLEDLENSDGFNRALQQSPGGSEFLMRVKVTFDQEPSPETSEVNENVKTIMEDLTYFVTNITNFAEEELRNVYAARRREFVIAVPSASEDTIPIIGESEDIPPRGAQQDATNGSVLTTISTVLGGATVIALATFFLVRRKKKQQLVEIPKSDVMYIDVENDVYSLDRSLESGSVSPRDHSEGESQQSPYYGESAMSSVFTHNSSSMNSATTSSDIQYDSQSTSPHGGDSIFSGISASPTSQIGPMRSLVTNASASTIGVSNVNRVPSPRHGAKSMSAHGSLFAFSEEDEDRYSESDAENGTISPPTSTGSRGHHGLTLLSSPGDAISDSSSNLQGAQIEHPPALGPDTDEEWDEEAVTTPKHVLDDLAQFEGTRRASDGELRQAIDSGNADCVAKFISTSSPDMCSPLPEESLVGNPPKPGDGADTTAGQIQENNLSTPTKRRRESIGDDASVDSLMETPLTRNVLPPPAARRRLLGGSPETDDSNGANGSTHTPSRGEWSASPGSIGLMSAAATGVIGGSIGDAVVGASDLANKDKPDTQDASISSSPRSERRENEFNATDAGSADGRYANSSTQVGYQLGAGLYNIPYAAAPPNFASDTSGATNQTREHEIEMSSLNSFESSNGAFPSESRGRSRRHAGNNAGADGSALYQMNAMHPSDWSLKSSDTSVGDSTISEAEGIGLPRKYIFTKNNEASSMLDSSFPLKIPSNKDCPKSPMSLTPRDSPGSVGEVAEPQPGAGVSLLSGSVKTGHTKETSASQASASRQLINDLVWLEKKIADVRNTPGENGVSPGMESADSLSYVSNDAFVSPSSNEEETNTDSRMSSIVCRDCFAPPGKLHIIIHSTKDGPAVHTVKPGSNLEGHVFAGDLIISVDNLDTRTFTAEQVMQLVASRSEFERKITVLHFEE